MTNFLPQSVHSKVGRFSGPYFFLMFFSTRLSLLSTLLSCALVVTLSASHQADPICMTSGGRDHFRIEAREDRSGMRISCMNGITGRGDSLLG